MKLFHTFENLPDDVRGAGIAIGNFDGLHLGHLGVIRQLKEECNARNTPLGVLMFDPTPFNFFRPDSPSKRIMSLKRRIKILKNAGVDIVWALPFDAEMANRTDSEFVEQVLVKGLGVSAVSVGFDFCFGKKRMGNTDTLQALGEKFGFDVFVAQKIISQGAAIDVEGEVLKTSSTQIRELIAAGDMKTAKLLKQDYWVVEAIVEHGEKRGRTLGFPTANMKLIDYQHPKHGIYAVWTKIAGESDWRKGVANFGRTPTTGERDPLLEVYIFDFDDDVYDKEFEVAFVEYLRPEEKFGDMNALVEQMNKDADLAKQILSVADKPLI